MRHSPWLSLLWPPQVRTSKRLRHVLKAVLEVGNRLNAVAGRSNEGQKIKGIALQSLLKLSEVL